VATAKATKRSKIKKGDQVVVMAGRDNGKRGRVLEVVPSKNLVKVEGIAIQKKHQRANPSNNRGGGILEREAFINISNVQLIDPETGKPTRVKYQINDDKTKTRVASGSGHTLDKA
jgi:large subunit ribosomal protein L24